jgi:hypothetical protein
MPKLRGIPASVFPPPPVPFLEAAILFDELIETQPRQPVRTLPAKRAAGCAGFAGRLFPSQMWYW